MYLTFAFITCNTMNKRFLLLFALVLLSSIEVWSQTGLGNVPKSVDWRDARITNVGVVASDVMIWQMEDNRSLKSDTVVTSETYILWQSNGDLEEQAAQHRAESDQLISNHEAKAKAYNKGLRSAKPIEQKGSLMEDYLAEFQYYVYTYEYPSVDASGKPVTLSAIAACPTKDADEVRDVVIGTHVTITADSQRPSARTNGFDKDDWGILMALAAGKKMKLGWKANLILGLGSSGYAGFILGPIAGAVTAVVSVAVWAGVGIAAEVKSGDDAYNNNLVIMADYEGYGVTKNRAHPYLYQELTARQVVDATRYGIALYKNDSGLSDIRHPIRSDFRSITCGYSQGGSVALATHRFIEQNGLVDELHFAGSLCGDGPYDPMATLMYYMKQNEESNKPMSMPVVLPLIVKGMLDSNPYMTGHKATDYFNPKFLETGIMDWLTSKNYSTGDITDMFVKCYKEGKNGQKDYFHDIISLDKDQEAQIKISDIMNEECYAYFHNIYLANKTTFTKKEGVPLPTTRGVFEDLHLALASNDMTKGWTPQHAILLFHSTSDTVVPYENATSAQNSLSGWTVLKSSSNGNDHVESGKDFFQGEEVDLVKNFAIQTYVAKKQLCNLPWKNQKKGSITQW